ncbi:hypothetical protein F3J14_00910 [Burkholderia sp. Tr-862]|uniref:hypothetical protein n=1 Tax=Burkholderia sp. Tr-862 TaxID=2608331 RepID=UPI0014193134|nr:hypothetical protein [Burkholderia sp. Tr-862]NIF39486.1 hypothetical protein [Burkholderia sp. Tr-862]
MAKTRKLLSQRRTVIHAGLWVPLYLALIPWASLASPRQDLEIRGKRFRTEIDKAYQKLPKSGPTQEIEEAGDITWLAVRYIPVGSSFDDAEVILRAAGFSVRPRPGPNQPGKLPHRYDVVARIEQYRTTLFFSRTDVYVLLSPKAPGDFYDGVSAIFASFTTSYL